MKIELAFGLLFLFASLGLWTFFFDSKPEYDWKELEAAKKTWKKLLEGK